MKILWISGRRMGSDMASSTENSLCSHLSSKGHEICLISPGDVKEANYHHVPLKDIRCGFILLKRGAKPGKVCELVKVSVGPKTLERAVKIMNSMIKMVKKGFNLKNRNSCNYCPYKDTEHCT